MQCICALVSTIRSWRSICDLSYCVKLLSGCLVLLSSCQRHLVSRRQGLNSGQAEGTGLLMEALCTLVTFTASFGNVPTGQSGQPLWFRGFCDSDGRLTFVFLFPRLLIFSSVHMFVTPVKWASLPSRSIVLYANRKTWKLCCCYHSHKPVS